MPRPEYPPTTKLDSAHTCHHEGDITILNTAILEIKDTLRDMKDLLTSNAVLEEQAVVTRSSLKNHDERLRTVELELAQSKGMNRWIDRIVWAVTAAALSGTVIYAIKMP